MNTLNTFLHLYSNKFAKIWLQDSYLEDMDRSTTDKKGIISDFSYRNLSHIQVLKLSVKKKFLGIKNMSTLYRLTLFLSLEI